MILGAWLSKWLSLYVIPSVRPSTADCYRRSAEAVPARLLAVELSTLSADDLLDLREWQLIRAAETPRAAQLDRVMISRAIRKAAALGLCPVLDVSEALPPISHHAAAAAVFSAEQLRRYVDLAPIYGGEEAPLLLLCCCGLRRGEALGSRWQDLTGSVLTINGSRDAQGRYGPPKSAHGVRSVVIPEAVLSVILAAPRSLHAPWIVDTTATRLQRAHKRVLIGSDLLHTRVTLHGLRHTIATLCAASGESMKLLQVALGHSHVNLTADLYADHITSPSACVVRAFESLNIAPSSAPRLEIV